MDGRAAHSRRRESGPVGAAASGHLRRFGVGALVAAVVLVVCAHVAYRVGSLRHPAWDLSRDGGVGEWLGYLVLGSAGLRLVVLAVQERALVLAAWAAVLLAAALDDALLVHERGGGWLVLRLGIPAAAGLRPQDLGEILVWGLVGTPLLLALVVTHMRSRGTVRRRSRTLALLAALLAGFAGGVDLLHQLLAPQAVGLVDAVLSTVEDAGELVVLAVLLGVVSGWGPSTAARGAGQQ